MGSIIGVTKVNSWIIFGFQGILGCRDFPGMLSFRCLRPDSVINWMFVGSPCVLRVCRGLAPSKLGLARASVADKLDVMPLEARCGVEFAEPWEGSCQFCLQAFCVDSYTSLCAPEAQSGWLLRKSSQPCLVLLFRVRGVTRCVKLCVIASGGCKGQVVIVRAYWGQLLTHTWLLPLCCLGMIVSWSSHGFLAMDVGMDPKHANALSPRIGFLLLGLSLPPASPGKPVERFQDNYDDLTPSGHLPRLSHHGLIPGFGSGR